MARTLAVMLTVLGLLTSSLDAALSPADRCTATKTKAASKKVSAKLKCHQKALVRGRPTDASCLARAEFRFDAAFAKAEARGGCAAGGDANTVEATVDQFIDALLTRLSGAPGSTTTTTARAPVSTSATSASSTTTSLSVPTTATGSTSTTQSVSTSATTATSTSTTGSTVTTTVPASTTTTTA